jgi:ribosomal protein L1
MVIGRVSQPAAELLQNLQALINTIQPAKIKKLVLCPTMGPGIKVAVEK